MKSILKKTLAAVLAAVLCLSLAGCYDENNTWAAKKGDDTLPIGAYVYYLNSAYAEARNKVSSEEEVLKAEIEDEETGEKTAAKDWMEDRALNYVRAYYYIADKFTELGLELSEEELSNAQSSTDSMWSYYKSTMEPMGIAKESFHKAFSLYNAKYQKVMEKVYGEGGELEIPEDELKTYFTENYYSYEYFYASLTKTDDSGNSVDMTDEEKTETKSTLETFVNKINSGSVTVEDAASEYAEDALGSADNSTYAAPTPTLADNMNDTIKTALEGVEDNKATLAETTTGYYVIRRLPIADKFEETVKDETQKSSLISTMKSDDFEDYVMEQAAKEQEGLELNTKAMGKIGFSKLVTDTNKKGASSASSSTESSAELSSQAEESSAADSSETSSAAE